MLSQEVTLRIREAVALGGKALEGRLPSKEDHPVRNPYAHIWREIKKKMGKSYRDCSAEDEGKILDIVRDLVDNPY